MQFFHVLLLQPRLKQSDLVPRLYTLMYYLTCESDDFELLLCPVRALKFYFDGMISLSPCPWNLFVSPKYPSRPL